MSESTIEQGRTKTNTMNANEVFLKLRGALTHLDKEVGAYMQSQGIDPAPGSQAATERTTYPRAESLYTVSAIGSMLLESVGEHVSLLIKGMTEPIEPLACWTCVRSMLESSSIAAWLFDPRVDAQKRVGRAYALRYEGLEEQVKFGRAANLSATELQKLENLVDERTRDAIKLGFPTVADQRGRQIGIAERMPSATEIIKTMLDEECAYRLLSAVAHGHVWAILRLGFEPLGIQPSQCEDGPRITAIEKFAGSVEGYGYLVARAAKSLAFPLWHQCLYFGWDKVRLAETLEGVYDQMHGQPAIRFWR